MPFKAKLKTRPGEAAVLHCLLSSEPGLGTLLFVILKELLEDKLCLLHTVDFIRPHQASLRGPAEAVVRHLP